MPLLKNLSGSVVGGALQFILQLLRVLRVGQFIEFQARKFNKAEHRPVRRLESGACLALFQLLNADLPSHLIVLVEVQKLREVRLEVVLPNALGRSSASW
jgi:hypothetical protein